MDDSGVTIIHVETQKKRKQLRICTKTQEFMKLKGEMTESRRGIRYHILYQGSNDMS